MDNSFFKDMPIILDVSRLISRAVKTFPTGIDRVELAYAIFLLNQYDKKDLAFAACHPLGRLGIISYDYALKMIMALNEVWQNGHLSAHKKAKYYAKLLKISLLNPYRKKAFKKNSIYLLLSHHHLNKIKKIQHFLDHQNASFYVMLHDIIPLEFPEYSGPKAYFRHTQRLQTIADLVKGIIVPTNDVKEDLKKYLPKMTERFISIWSVPHGVDKENSKIETKNILSQNQHKPYFVYISTIEPRKNHLLLLNIWRRIVNKYGAENAPRLILIGARGWENENIIDMLDRCNQLKDVVEEKSKLSDSKVIEILKGARALLFPSFTEGYGLPLIEAFSFNVPVICSDIPVFREIGQNIPEFIDPLDGPSWQKKILDYAYHDEAREEQLKRLKTWHPLSWDESVATALSKIIDAETEK